MSESYHPSNSTEGEIFIAKWCQHCVHIGGVDDKDSCQILGDSFAFDIDHKSYPTAWVQDDESGPQCTEFSTEDGVVPLDPRAVIRPLL